ncbi:hypothetical protein PoB_007163900 [Plakobranchus ocellatus]|uniref:Uncharacterized protein n=1 Tax=Plakobranchus ocellatus TaxID=259542 RepID=A0AAV4DMB5_9GAST|nr:hypothetical protein PoB_007163900 [Plakobranchus ocellatus]
MPNRRRQPRCGFRSFMPATSFNRPDSKEPLRRGILFSSIAFVLLLIGAMLTWLGLNEPFSNNVSMTGPLLIAIALLMLLLSLRQFMLARKRNRAITGTVQMDTISTGGVTAVVVDDEEGNRAATIVVEAWDTDEPIHDEIRNPRGLAPPAYTDISQSCSSMCPSFVSHEDHNEAPPTYEETCGGVYGSSSERSLSQQGSPHNSSQELCSDTLQSDPPAYVPSNQALDGNQDGVALEAWNGVQEASHNLLSPVNSGTLMAQAAVRRQRPAPPPPLALSDSPEQQTDVPSSSFGCAVENASGNSIVRSLSPENLSPSSIGNAVDKGRLVTTAPPTPVPIGAGQADLRDLNPTWSRRSFSSVPSYTCLLSKSGEVSAQVFDTSSIIQGMMPHRDQQESAGTQRDDKITRKILSPSNPNPAFSVPSANHLSLNNSAIPTRSHSLTSVLPLRQGVPYNFENSHELLSGSSKEQITLTPHLTYPTCTVSTPQQQQQCLEQCHLQSQQTQKEQHKHLQDVLSQQHTSLSVTNITSTNLSTSNNCSNEHFHRDLHCQPRESSQDHTETGFDMTRTKGETHQPTMHNDNTDSHNYQGDSATDVARTSATVNLTTQDCSTLVLSAQDVQETI